MAQTSRIYDSFQEYEYDTYQPTDRFYVRASVYLPGGDIDPRTGKIREDLHRRGRTQALRMEAQRLDQEYEEMDVALHARQNEKGIRISLRTAISCIFALVVIFAITLLIQQGTLTQKQRSIRMVGQQIETLRSENNDLQAKIAEASDSATICYAAARDLGMVPSEAAQAIHLTAVDTRPGNPSGHVTASAAGVPNAETGSTTGE